MQLLDLYTCDLPGEYPDLLAVAFMSQSGGRCSGIAVGMSMVTKPFPIDALVSKVRDMIAVKGARS
jgi:hypothetical protein